MRKVFLVIFACMAVVCFSQENRQKNALFTIRGNIGIPRTISSKMFRTAFGGIYEANLSLNLRLFNNFYAGAGYQNTFFRNSKFIGEKFYTSHATTFSIPYTTSINGSGIFVKLGYDKFFSDIGYIGYSINSGVMLAHYADVVPDSSVANRPFGPMKFTAPYIQPELSVNFIAEKRLSFSIMLSYTTLLYKFDPKSPRFNDIEEVKKARNRYVMSWINIGFGFSVLLGK